MKGKIKRIFCIGLAAAVMFCANGVAPVFADFEYQGAGNKAYAKSKGEMTAFDAIMKNLAEYDAKLLNFAAEQVKGIPKDDAIEEMLKDTKYLKEINGAFGDVMLVHDLMVESAYAFSDLGKALANAWSAKQKLYRSIQDNYYQSMQSLTSITSATYQRGVKDRFTNNKPPTDALNAIDSLIERTGSQRADSIRDGAKNKIFFFDYKTPKKIREMADILQDACEKSPSALEIYNLGRFGVKEWDYDNPPTITEPAEAKDEEIEKDEEKATLNYSKNYKSWKSNDAYWKNVYLDSGKSAKLGSYSAATALAILIVDSKIKSVDNFNPKVFVESAKKTGAINSSGSTVWEKINTVAKGFDLDKEVSMKKMSRSEKLKAIQECYDAGYKVIIQVVGSDATYVALDKVKDGVVYMCDPKSKNTDLFKTYGDNPNYLMAYDYPGRKALSSPTSDKVYTLSYDKNGGEGTVKGTTVKFGEKFTIAKNAFKKSGYTFKGWVVKRQSDSKWYVSGTGWVTSSVIESKGYEKKIYKEGDTLTFSESWIKDGGKDTDKYTFYVRWEKNKSTEKDTKYTISYDGKGGDGTVKGTTVSLGEEFNIAKNSFKKDGYAFKGWNVQRQSDKKWYTTEKGWVTADSIKSNSYTKRLYKVGDSFTLSNSWTKQGGNEKSDKYIFYAVWEKKETEKKDTGNSKYAVEQNGAVTCTLAASVMMFRKQADLDGKDWEGITEDKMESAAWAEGAGLKFEFTYKGMSASAVSLDSYVTKKIGEGKKNSAVTKAKKERLITLLNKHPEGIVAYNHSTPHAIWLTRYNEDKDIFYAVDPGRGMARKEVKLVDASLPGSTQDKVISNINQYWYIK